MESFKVYVENRDYQIDLEIKDEILHFIIIDLQNKEDNFKNNYTYKKLITKVEELGYFTNNIQDIQKEFKDAIKKTQYSFWKSDFFALFTFEFKRFPNAKKDFKLELFLYKTDSRQATLMVTQLEEKVEKVIEENKELIDSFKTINQEIVNITEKNKEIKNKIDTIQNEVLNVINKRTDDISILTISKKKEIFEKLDKIKDVLNFSIKSSRRQTLLNTHELPIIRSEDKKNLAKWIGLEFDIEKIYDSMLQGDSLEGIKQCAMGKQQTLTVVEIESGRRFGFYMAMPYFNESEDYVSDDPSAMIISFDRRRKFPISNLKYIAKFTSEGIFVGSGPDIYISEGFTKDNKNYSNIQGSYGEKEVLEEGFSRNNYLAGIEYFKIRKIEIHQIVFK